jgi:membrane-bound acyltransferase YfiQ involved in biofilm formation
MDDFGKSVGAEMDKLGKDIGRQMERAGKDFSSWWDRTFGILSPVIIGTIGVVILLFFVLVGDIAASGSGERAFWRDLTAFARDYLWLFILLIFAASFSDYFLRRYRKVYLWVRPPVTATLVVGWVWAFAQVAKMLDEHYDAETMGMIGRFLEDFWWLVFVIALMIGYLFAWAWLMGSVVRQQEEDMLRYRKQ